MKSQEVVYQVRKELEPILSSCDALKREAYKPILAGLAAKRSGLSCRLLFLIWDNGREEKNDPIFSSY